MFPKPKAQLKPNTYAYESEPMVKATGFREYDARWLFGSEINLMGVEALGLGLGTLIGELGVKPDIVTGHDFRSYSASIKMALINGLIASGCRVRDIGPDAELADQRAEPHAQRLDAHQVDFLPEQPARVVFAEPGRLDHGLGFIGVGIRRQRGFRLRKHIDLLDGNPGGST